MQGKEGAREKKYDFLLYVRTFFRYASNFITAALYRRKMFVLGGVIRFSRLYVARTDDDLRGARGK